MAPEYEGRVRFAKANTNEAVDTAARFMVMGIPTVVALKGGEVVDKVSGGQKRPRVEKMIAAVT